MNPCRLALVCMSGVLVLAAIRPTGAAPAPSLDPLRPTFTGAVLAARTTTVGPGGASGGTRVGGVLAAALADVTGNGVLDVVAAGRAGDGAAGAPSVIVHPGRGDGTFDPPAFTTCSASASSRILARDLDGDGDVDVVLGGAGTPATYAVLRGHGDGTFTELGTFTLNTPSVISGAGLAAGRFDADDRLDLAVVASGGQVAIFLGGAPGGFGPPAFVGTGGVSADVAAADLDGDGAMDLVLADSAGSRLIPLAGAGDGTFAPLPAVPTATVPNRVAAVDVVGDALPDLVAAGPGAEILRHDGGFAFTSVHAGAAGGFGRPAVLDADGDGDRDVVLGIPGTVLLGDGLGGFTPAAPGVFMADAGSFGAPLAAPADLDGDGRLDLLTLSGGGTVSVDRSPTALLAVGGTLLNPRVVSLGGIGTGAAAGVVAADVDGDGRDDLATVFASTTDGIAYVAVTYSGDGSTTLFPYSAPLLANPGPTAITAGDLDGDGTDDLVVASGLASLLPVQLTVLLGDRNRQHPPFVALSSNVPAGPSFAGLAAVTVADLDGDGTPEIVGFTAGGGAPPALTPSTGCVYRSDGAGGFALVGTFAAARVNSARVPAADLDGDGRDDLLLRTSATTLSVLPGAPGALPGPATGVSVPPSVGLVAGDLDGDGRGDWAVFPGAAGGWNIVWAPSLGGFTSGAPTLSPVNTPDAGGGATGLVADVNGDGLPDLVTDGAAGADLGVFVQRTDGTFVHVSLATLTDGSGIAAGDLDGDGRIDLANVGAVGGSPLFHELFLNTTLDVPEVRDPGRRKARRGEIVELDVELRRVRPGFRADLGPGVTVFRHEPRGGDDWRLHLLVSPEAEPGERDLAVVRPDGDEGASGLDGARSEARVAVLRVLEDGVEPFIKKLEHPKRSKGYLPAGYEGFTLKLKGDGYASGAVVYVGGWALPTEEPRKKGRKIKASVPAERVADPGVLEVILVNPVGPPSNTVLLTVLGPEVDRIDARRRSDGSLRLKVRGRNFRRDGLEAVVRRLDTSAEVSIAKFKRSSKKKLKITIDEESAVPAGVELEVVVSYEGALGNRIESAPVVVLAP